jgi:2-dehydropantoate 2-reductase
VKDADGAIRHLGEAASITFGEREGQPANAQLAALAEQCARAGVDALHAPRIASEQWAKFTFLAALAAGTCLMRASIGDIVASREGDALMRALHAECLAVADAAGEPVAEDAAARARATLTAAGSPLKASMLRDIEAGARIEGAHIVGDMLQRAGAAGIDAPCLAVAWAHLQAYGTARDRVV